MSKLILIVFGLPFAGIGGWEIVQSLHDIGARQPSLFGLLMHWPIGVLFSVVGWLFILLGVFGKEVKPGSESPLAQHKRLLGIKTPEEQWEQRRIVAGGTGQVIGAWFVFLLGVLLLAPALWVAMTRGVIERDVAYQWWGFSALVPLILLAQAAYRTLRWRKYGTSTCDLERLPSLSNGLLRCVIRTGTQALPGGEALVRLRCEKREYQKIGRARRLNVTVLWQDEQKVTVSPVGLGMDVSFIVPVELPNAAPNRNQGIFWFLEARSATPGIDYYAQFNLALQRREV